MTKKTKIEETINKEELARRVGDIVLFNNASYIFDELGEYDNLVNGSIEYTNDENDDNAEVYYEEIYQMYAISDSGAEYLIDYTDEIVFYSEKMGLYIWGITHFGMSWSMINVDIYE